MPDISDISITMQGSGNPVSATGQGEQAGPQPSSSYDRSSSQVDNLARVEYNATRNPSSNHDYLGDPNQFCYICGKFEVAKYRRPITDLNRTILLECFKMQIPVGNTWWVPQVMCCTCLTMLNRWKKSKGKEVLQFNTPTIWQKPQSCDDCYFWKTITSGFN